MEDFLKFIRIEEIIKNSNSIIVMLSREGKIVYVNKNFLELTGYKKEEIIGKNYFEIFIDNSEKVREFFFDIINKGKAENHTNYIFKKNREPALILWDNYIVKDKENIIGTLSFGQCQEEKNKFIKDLKQEYIKYSNLCELLPYLIYHYQIEPEKKIIYISPYIEKLTGYTKEEIYKDNIELFEKFTLKEDIDKYRNYIKEKNFSEPLKLRWIHKDGGIIWIEAKFIDFSEKNENLQIQAVIRNISYEIKQAEEINEYIKTLTSISTIDNIFNKYIAFESHIQLYIEIGKFLKEISGSEYILIGILNENKDLEIKYMSENVYDICQLDNIIPHIRYKNSPSRWSKTLEDGKVYIKNECGNVPEGHIKINNFISIPIKKGEEIIGVIILANKKEGFSSKDEYFISKLLKHIQDRLLHISEIEKMHKMEKRLLKNQMQAQKIESLGTLAGGIAHDFNNFLLAISSDISYLKEEIKEDKYSEVFKNIFNSIDSASSLAKQLISFSKGGAPIQEKVNSKEFLKNSFIFSSHALKCKTEISIAEDLYDFSIDKNQISQVITNLIINAWQAVESKENRLISLKAENFYQENDSLNLKKGKYVKIIISDNGIGISKENLKKIFEPFFTTKERGHGLGLYMVYSIIKKHQGYVEVESEEGKGTAIKIYLPAIEEKIPIKNQEIKEIISVDKLKILILDDEEIILNSLKRLIQSINADVFAAKNSNEAFNIIKENKINIALIDLTLIGDISGEKVNIEIKKIDPEIYTVATSGYSDENILSSYQKYNFNDILPKPYKLDDLKKIIGNYNSWIKYNRDN